MDFCGALGFVLRLTDVIFLPLTFNWNERSRMQRNNLDLCGIIATGDIFRAGGMLFFMSAHLTMDA